MTSIRRYAGADWAAIARVHDVARVSELTLTVGTKAFRTLEDTADEEGLFDGDLWVAEVDDATIGFVALADGEITWLYVDPTYARHGIGRALLRHAIGQGDGPFTASVLAGNEPAISLYLAEGFEIVETRDGHLQGMEDIPARGHLLRRP